MTNILKSQLKLLNKDKIKPIHTRLNKKKVHKKIGRKCVLIDGHG